MQKLVSIDRIIHADGTGALSYASSRYDFTDRSARWIAATLATISSAACLSLVDVLIK